MRFNERLGIPLSLQGCHQPEPLAVPEAGSPAPGQNPDGGECQKRHGGCLRSGLRERDAIQPEIGAGVWTSAWTGCREDARQYEGG